MIPIAIGRCANENKCAVVLIKKECADGKMMCKSKSFSIR
jgi:hypothetical protein